MLSSFKNKLRHLILSEHSRTMADTVVNEIGDDEERFKALMDLLSEGDYRLTQRAAWPLALISDKRPAFITPYIHDLILKLKEPAHPALHRNIVRILQGIEIPSEEQGVLADACFLFLYHNETPIATKCFSISVLHNICLKEPDLAKEICLYIEERISFESAAFKSRGRKFLAYWGNNL